MAAATLDKIDMSNEVDNQHTIIEILDRCPQFVKSKWRTLALNLRRNKKTYPTFSEFVDFICKLAVDWADPVYGHDTSYSSKGVHSKSAFCHGFSGESKPVNASSNSIS